MKKHLNNFSGHEKAFTLIELIVVIAIITILAAIVVVNVTSYIEKTKNAAMLAEFGQLKMYARNYYADNGNYDYLCYGDGIYDGTDGGYNGTVAKIGQAIANRQSGGMFYCMDPTQEFHQSATSLIPVAYAMMPQKCSSDRFMVVFYYDFTSSGGGYCVDSDGKQASFTGVGPSLSGVCICP